MTACLGIGLCTSCTPETPTAPQDYTQYVNTFIGAADNGHTFPGACLPFGLIQGKSGNQRHRMAILLRIQLSGFADLGILTDSPQRHRLHGSG